MVDCREKHPIWRDKEMKLKPMTQSKRGQRHPPVRTFTELAAEVGKTVPELRGLFSGYPDAPKATMVRRKDHLYNLDEFRRWYAKLPR